MQVGVLGVEDVVLGFFCGVGKSMREFVGEIGFL